MRFELSHFNEIFTLFPPHFLYVYLNYKRAIVPFTFHLTVAEGDSLKPVTFALSRALVRGATEGKVLGETSFERPGHLRLDRASIFQARI